MKVKQLRLELDLKDKIFNLSEQDRKFLLSELSHKLTWANYENFRYNEKEYFKIWQYIKHNPKTAYAWIEEILSKT